MQDLVELGRTAGAYGFRGWIRIVPLQSGEVLRKAKTWVFTDRAGARQTLEIEAVRPHGNGLIAKWVGCESKEDADKMRGMVSVAREDFPDAGDKAVWAVDLIASSVVTADGTVLGTVESIGSNGVQDILNVAYQTEDDKKALFMIPIVKDVYILAIDTDAKTITVDWDPQWR